MSVNDDDFFGPPAEEEAPKLCPTCGDELLHGYGLMGGGMGAYLFCSADGCDYFTKTPDREDE